MPSNLNEHILSALSELETPSALEALGNTLALKDAVLVLDYFYSAPSDRQWKLTPVLAGMNPSTFEMLVFHANDTQLKTLQQTVGLEPMQLHITHLCFEWDKKSKEVSDRLEELEALISKNSPDELVLIKRDIAKLKNAIQDLLPSLNKTLAIIWFANRTDLIERLSALKEFLQRALTVNINELNNKLQASLLAIFNDYSEDTPAISAIALFLIRYPTDYNAIGLLPTVSDPNTLKDNQDEFTEQARKNLSKMGLNTVQDLKTHGIYSRKMLQDYIRTMDLI